MRDFSGVKASTKFEGKFPAIINAIKDGVSKSGKEMLTVEFKVVGQEFKDYKISTFFVWENPRSLNSFAKLLDATEVPRNLSSYSELHNKMCEIEVVYKGDNSNVSDFFLYKAPSEEV